MSDDFKRGIELLSQRELNLKTNERNKPDKLNRHRIIKNSALCYFCYFFRYKSVYDSFNRSGIHEFRKYSVAQNKSKKKVCSRKIDPYNLSALRCNMPACQPPDCLQMFTSKKSNFTKFCLPRGCH